MATNLLHDKGLMLNSALRLVRVFHDKSQKELASSLGISASYISEIESGKKKPTLELVQRYSEAFSIPASSLLLFSENLPGDKQPEKIRASIAEKVIKMLDWIAIKDIGNEGGKT